MSDEPTFKIPREVIQPIIEAHVRTAVLGALGDKANLIDSVVMHVLTRKVDDRGSETRYDHGSMQWIVWAMRQAIECAAKEMIQKYLEDHRESLKASILGVLTKKDSKLSKQLVSGMIEALTHPEVLKYRINVSYDRTD